MDTPVTGKASTASKPLEEEEILTEEMPEGQAGVKVAPMSEGPSKEYEETHASPQRSAEDTAPPRGAGDNSERGEDPSSSRGPALDPSEPERPCWTLMLTGAPPGRGAFFAAAMPAVHKGLDKLDEELAAEEE